MFTFLKSKSSLMENFCHFSFFPFFRRKFAKFVFFFFVRYLILISFFNLTFCVFSHFLELYRKILFEKGLLEMNLERLFLLDD